MVRALGRAWVQSDGAGGWKRKRGTPANGALTKAEATVRMLGLVREHHTEQTRLEEDAEKRRRRGITFRELTVEWIVFLAREKGARPSTLIDYRWMLAEPGQPHRRGKGRAPGLLMRALGDQPIATMTTRDIAGFLRSLDDAGGKPRTINRYRQLISAAFNYSMREDAYGLAANPAAATIASRATAGRARLLRAGRGGAPGSGGRAWRVPNAGCRRDQR